MTPDAKRRPAGNGAANKTAVIRQAQNSAAARDERHAAAFSIATRAGARLQGWLSPRDFHDPTLGRLHAVSMDPDVLLAEELAAVGDREGARLRAIARKSGVDLRRIEELVDDRPSMLGRSGAIARRVRLDSLRRQMWATAEDLTAAAKAGDMTAWRTLVARADRLQAAAATLEGDPDERLRDDRAA